MDIKPIRSQQDYQDALVEIDRLWDSEPGTPEGDKLDLLIIITEDYEKKHFRTTKEDPIETILYYLDSQGLTRADLVKYIGPRSRVSEILNRKRPLTLRMIRNLSTGLGIPAEILIQPYLLDNLENVNIMVVISRGERYKNYWVGIREESPLWEIDSVIDYDTPKIDMNDPQNNYMVEGYIQ